MKEATDPQDNGHLVSGKVCSVANAKMFKLMLLLAAFFVINIIFECPLNCASVNILKPHYCLYH